MSSVKVYGIPNCGTCKKAIQWLEKEGIEAFSKDPMLIKRPLFVKNNQAVLVGFRASEEVKKEKLLNS